MRTVHSARGVASVAVVRQANIDDRALPIAASLREIRRDMRQGGPPEGPTGWYIVTEVDVRLEPSTVVAPDVCGWRRSRATREQLIPRPVGLVPDWVCEILSPSNRRNDLVVKESRYRGAKVPHYWILDPTVRALTVYRWSEQGYVLALAGEAEDLVRPEPFGDVEVRVKVLFTNDDD